MYFLGLSLRNTSKALEPFVERSYIAIWYRIYEEFDPKHLYPNKRKSRITAFIVDETKIQIGPNEAWLWVAVEEPIHRRILGIYIFKTQRNMLIAESFLDLLLSYMANI